MKLYTEEELLKAIQLGRNYGGWVTTEPEILKQLTPIELPSDEEIGKEDIINLWNWLNDGYVIRRSLPTIEELIGWFEAKWMKEQILGKEDKTFKQKSKWTEVDNMTRRLK
jgi:hypothetical protein